MKWDFMMMGEVVVMNGIVKQSSFKCEAFFKTAEGKREPDLVFVRTHRPYQQWTPEGLAALGENVDLELSYIIKGGEPNENIL